jgi:hypothetical protein
VAALEGTGSTGYTRFQCFASASGFGEKRMVDGSVPKNPRMSREERCGMTLIRSTCGPSLAHNQQHRKEKTHKPAAPCAVSGCRHWLAAPCPGAELGWT